MYCVLNGSDNNNSMPEEFYRLKISNRAIVSNVHFHQLNQSKKMKKKNAWINERKRKQLKKNMTYEERRKKIESKNGHTCMNWLVFN